jgi:hypothetical protein
MMRRLAAYGFGFAALFLSLVALLVGAPALFYMGTAVLVTIAVARLQAWLSVRYLRIERIAPSAVHVGELVTVEVVVWSERRIRRPLVTVMDALPRRMGVADLTPSMPIAPAYDLPVRSQYQFRPLRRGRFRWSGSLVQGSDALGMASVVKRYGTEVTELLVKPMPIPIAVELPMTGGLGISEAGSGQSRGGLEPRGIREYTPGDPLRHVHWRSSARAGTLLVKEFEAGSQALVGILMQRTKGTELGQGIMSSLDLMVGHALYMAAEFRQMGAEPVFPQLESPEDRLRGAHRLDQVEEMLAGVVAGGETTLGMELLQAGQSPLGGTTFYVLCILADPSLPSAISQLIHGGRPVTVVVYNPTDFKARSGLAEISAADPLYVDALTEVGARVVFAPPHAA